MKQVYVILCDGFEEIEALTPVDYLRRAGLCVTTLSLGEKNVKGGHDIIVQADKIFDESLDLPDCIVIPGGMGGATGIAKNQNILNFILKCYKSEKIVASICASPAVVLAKLGILKNNSYTCYPGMEDELFEYGANDELLESSKHIKDCAFVTSKNLVTGKGPGAAEQFSMELVRLLCGESVAKKVHDSSVQR